MFTMLSMLLAFGLCTGAGFLWADRLRSRALALEELSQCLRHLGMLMRYSGETLALLARRAHSRTGSPLFEAFSRALEAQAPPGEAWRQAWDRCGSSPRYAALQAPELSALERFAAHLGSADPQGEAQRLALALEELDLALADAQQKNQTRGRLYRTLGMLLGLAAAIVLW